MNTISQIGLRRKSLLATISVAAFVLAQAGTTASAQQVIANGTPQTAFGTYNTGVATGSAGYGFNVSNGGSITGTGPVTIITGGSSAYGVFIANTGGAVTLNSNSSISTSGTSAYGAYITGTGTMTVNADLAITTTGSSAYGVYIANTGSFTANGSSRVTVAAGPSGIGFYLPSGGTASLQGGGSITTANNYAIYTSSSSQFSGKNLTILTTGSSTSIRALGTSQVTLDGGSVTGWSNSNTIQATGSGGGYLSGPRVILSNISVTTTNDSNATPGTAAAVSVDRGGYFDVRNAVITTYSDSGEGVIAFNNASGIIRDSTITTYGSNAVPGDAGAGSTGARSGIGSEVTVINTNITTHGQGSSGIEADDGGKLTMTGGSISTTNVGAQGILSTATASGNPSSQIDVTNVPISAAGDGIGVFGGAATITLTNSQVTTGSNLALNVRANPGALGGPLAANATVLADHSTITGAMITEAGSTSHVTLQNDTLWNLTGNSNLTTLTNDGSTIAFSPPSGGVFKTLTVDSYVGAAGTIGFNTFLSVDGSPSDLLILNGGTATGHTFVTVTNAGGAGALTSGNGILLVDAQNGAVSDPGSFTLGLPAVAGPYEYLLYRGALDGSNDNSWYLRSSVIPGPPPVPNYRRETSLYAAIPAQALTYGWTLIDTLHERVGGQRPLALAPVTEDRTVWCKNPEKNFRCTVKTMLRAEDRTEYVSYGWGRVIGEHGSRDGSKIGIYGRGPDYDYDIFAGQAGLDLYRSERSDGASDQAGLYVAYGQLNGDVKHFDANLAQNIFAGKNTLDAYSVGGYWTHHGASGWYMDGVVQGTWYDVEADSRRGLRSFDTDGFGLALSLEAGVPFAFGGGFVLEPQGQVIYQRLNLDTGYDGAATVRFDDGESLLARVGLRLARTWALEEGQAPRMITAWGRVNLWHEFMGDPKTQFSSDYGYIPFHADLGGTWAELTGGVDAQVATNVSVFASAGYQIGLDGNRDGYNGKLGLKIKW